MASPLNKRIEQNYPGLDDLSDFLTKTYDLLVELKAWAEALGVKLNADAGVTDDDYDEDITAETPSDPDA